MSSLTERTASREPTVRNFSLTRSTSVVRPVCDLILHIPRPRLAVTWAATRDRPRSWRLSVPWLQTSDICRNTLTVRARRWRCSDEPTHSREANVWSRRAAATDHGVVVALHQAARAGMAGGGSPDSRAAVAFDAVCRCLPHRHSSDPSGVFAVVTHDTAAGIC